MKRVLYLDVMDLRARYPGRADVLRAAEAAELRARSALQPPRRMIPRKSPRPPEARIAKGIRDPEQE
jgi:hypothetical protein